MWLPSNNVQLSFSGNWEYRHNAIVIGYEYRDGVIYNQYVNSGNLNQVEGGVNLTLKMLSGKLGLMPGVSLLHMHHTGMYPFNINNIYGSLMGGYILNSKWSLNMYIMSPPGKTYRKSQGGYAKFHSAFVKVGASYSSGDFSASVAVMPLYKRDHQSGYMDGRHVNMTEDRWSATGGRRIDLSLKYTFNFGKKVGRRFMYVDDVTVTTVR